ncbi:MAG: OmpA family protein [Azonexus sp.]
METLGALLDAINHASTEQRGAIDALVASAATLLERAGGRLEERLEAESARLDMVAAQVTGSAAEVASLGEAFGLAVERFSDSNNQLMAALERIEGALGKTLARSDDQLAYYVAQAREIIDLSTLSQKRMVDDLQELSGRQLALLAASLTMDHSETLEPTAPVWAVFGDLMAGLLGFRHPGGVPGVQLDLVSSLEAEVKKRQVEEQRRQALEKALAIPLASGRVTFADGRIGISGSVLFALNSDQLQPEGRQLLKTLAAPLAAYLGAREEMLMVSGFTDDRPVLGSNRQFADNLELSAQRALTVTRALIEAGLPSDAIFAAA